MYYAPVEKSLQIVLKRCIPLSSVQLDRLTELVVALLLAGETTLAKIARQLPHRTQQDSRIRWTKRVLEAPFMTQAYVYQPWIKQVLQTHQVPTLHLVTDRTDLIDHQLDLVTINLNFRKRALPIVWQLCPTGRTSAALQIALLNRCQAFLPLDRHLVFHGDNEFGSVAVMRWLAAHHWDFILGQAATTYYRSCPMGSPHPLSTLPVTPTHAVYGQHVQLTKTHWFGPVNLFAFYQPVYRRNRRKQEVRYYATSLPSAPTVRRVGQRRWGVECYYKDLKSAGWNLSLSHLQHGKRLEGLLIALNLAYTWATCLGRWLCKSSQRSWVDNHPQRQLSLFRLGWDWLVHTIRSNSLCPALSTLYS